MASEIRGSDNFDSGTPAIPDQTGMAQQVLTTDGTTASWLDNHTATLLFGTALTANTVGGTSNVNVTVNLAESMNNFRGLAFIGANWGNMWYYPVALLNNTAKMYSNVATADGAGHMNASYDTYHYYIRRVSDTSFYITAGVGNGVSQIWGIK